MDYSASIHDADHPAGASPWGNSPTASPEANQGTFGTPRGEDSLASPTAFGSQISGNGFGGEADEDVFGPPDHGFGRRPDTASTVSEGDTHTQTSETEGGDSRAGAFNNENVSPTQSHDPNRFSGDTARASQEQEQAHAQAQGQIRKSTQPQYKLQAKITGLERAARKDPILRFDVHVSLNVSLLCLFSGADCCRPTSPSSERPNSEMSGACTLNLSSWPNT